MKGFWGGGSQGLPYQDDFGTQLSGRLDQVVISPQPEWFCKPNLHWEHFG